MGGSTTGNLTVTGKFSGDIPWPELLSRRGRGIKGSLVDSSLSILETVPRDVIPLAMGCPGDDNLPVREVAELADRIMAEEGAAALNYMPTEGDRALRLHLVEEVRAEGVPAELDNVLITTGGMQGLDLTCKLMVESGDPVLVETPAYSNGLATICNYQGELHPVPMDEEGILVEAVQEVLEQKRRSGRPVKMIYVIPNFQNPSGRTISLRRRERLLELARRYHAVIMEDDPYRRLRFSGEDLPSLLALDEGRGTVIHVNTFSKVFAPGLRVGWVCAPREVIRRMVAARQSMDTCTNALGQKVVSRFCRSGRLAPLVSRLADDYRAKKETMLAALARHFGPEHDPAPGGVYSWSDPGGGMFVWMTMPPHVVAEQLFPLALEEGVAFIPGSAFDFTKSRSHEMRLCFSYPPRYRLEEGIARLRQAVRRLLETQAHAGAN